MSPQISNEEPPVSALENNPINEPQIPIFNQDLKDSFNPDSEGTKDENLEPAETFGFGYGLGIGYSGYRGYGGYGGYGGEFSLIKK